MIESKKDSLNCIIYVPQRDNIYSSYSKEIKLVSLYYCNWYNKRIIQIFIALKK